MNVYFSNIKDVIINQILSAKFDIKIAVAWFTNDHIFEALLEKSKDSRIKIKIILIKDRINIKPCGINFNRLIENGCELFFGNDEELMHHKFCLVDENIIISGSYNWTYMAENRNSENIICIENQKHIADGFKAEFERLIFNKIPEININPNDTKLQRNSSFDLQDLQIQEYLQSAKYYVEKGEHTKAGYVFAEANQINSWATNRFFIQENVISDSEKSKIITQITSKTQNSTLTYRELCDKMLTFIRRRDYISAVNLAQSYEDKYKNMFSIHVYCGDAKFALKDFIGAEKEYRKALNFSFDIERKSHIIYYNQVFVTKYFPHASLYVKLNENEKALNLMNEAIKYYSNIGNKNALAKACAFLEELQNK